MGCQVLEAALDVVDDRKGVGGEVRGNVEHQEGWESGGRRESEEAVELWLRREGFQRDKPGLGGAALGRTGCSYVSQKGEKLATSSERPTALALSACGAFAVFDDARNRYTRTGIDTC